ncbi:MAG: hypothetical protein CMO55_00660 [Verrucomicrobiales bacterium]|nr:hypothetical protein [Verrucomicrobiales bacterium]
MPRTNGSAKIADTRSDCWQGSREQSVSKPYTIVTDSLQGILFPSIFPFTIIGAIGHKKRGGTEVPPLTKGFPLRAEVC